MIISRHLPPRAARVGASMALWAAVGLVVRVADAEPDTTPTVAVLDGRARFDEGLRLAEAGDHAGAMLEFKQAWELLKAPAVLFNLARAEELAGYPVDALLHFRQFAELSDPKIGEQQRELAARNIAELSTKVGHIAVVAAPGAHVSIDGRRVDVDREGPIAVRPGRHVVEAVVDGHATTLTVDCAAGAVTEARFTRVEPLAADARAKDEATSGGRGATGWAVPVGIGALGVVAAATGVAFTLASNATNDEYRALAQPGLCADRTAHGCAAYLDKHGTALAQRRIAVVGYAAGGVLVAASLAVFALWPEDRSPSSGSLRVVPVVGMDARGGGASLRATF